MNMDEYEKIEQPNGDILFKKKHVITPKTGEVWIDDHGDCVIIDDEGGCTILWPRLVGVRFDPIEWNSKLVGVRFDPIEWNSKWKRLGMFDEVYELKE
jgi:hypothetical protein